MPLKKFKPFLK